MTFKLKALMSVFATITLLTAPAVKSDEFTRIATKQQYQKLAVGKRWYLGEGYAIARRNGSVQESLVAKNSRRPGLGAATCSVGHSKHTPRTATAKRVPSTATNCGLLAN